MPDDATFRRPGVRGRLAVAAALFVAAAAVAPAAAMGSPAPQPTDTRTATVTASALDVQTEAVTRVNETALRFDGNLTSLGGADNATVRFRYWPNGNKSALAKTPTTECDSPCTFSETVTGLEPGTTYAVEPVAAASDGDSTFGSGAYERTQYAGDVRGTVLYPNGTAAANETIFLISVYGAPSSLKLLSTNASGGFHVEDFAAGYEYELAFYQQLADRADLYDGVPIVHMLANRKLGGSENLGTVRLPTAHHVNVTVVDESGTPVPDAGVNYDDPGENNGAKGWLVQTNEAGMANSSGLPPGVEVAGETNFVVDPPNQTEPTSRFRDTRYVRTVNVTGPRNLTVTLTEADPLSVQTADATAVNESALRVDSNLTAQGGAQNATVRVRYWEQGDRANASLTGETLCERSVNVSSGGVQDFADLPCGVSTDLTGLSANTTYVVQAVAENNTGATANGSTATVRTDYAGDLTGTVERSDGSGAADTVVVLSAPGTPPVRSGAANATGVFGVSDFPTAATYSVAVSQDFAVADATRNGVPDLYHVTNASYGSDATLGTVSLPAGHVTNVTVLNESGGPVANAQVTVRHDGGADLTLYTNSDGRLQAASNPVGLELAGNVTVTVSPPPAASGFADATYTRSLTVTDASNVSVTLDAASAGDDDSSSGDDSDTTTTDDGSSSPTDDDTSTAPSETDDTSDTTTTTTTTTTSTTTTTTTTVTTTAETTTTTVETTEPSTTTTSTAQSTETTQTTNSTTTDATTTESGSAGSDESSPAGEADASAPGFDTGIALASLFAGVVLALRERR